MKSPYEMERNTIATGFAIAVILLVVIALALS